MIQQHAFTGSFQDAVVELCRATQRLGTGARGVLPDRVEVNIEDWIEQGGKGMCMRFPFLGGLDAWLPGRHNVDTWPSDFVPRGTLVALWRERRSFASELWSKWYAGSFEFGVSRDVG